MNLKNNILKWKTSSTESLSDKHCIWDWLKDNIRNRAISYSKQLSPKTETEKKKIANHIKEATK